MGIRALRILLVLSLAVATSLGSRTLAQQAPTPTPSNAQDGSNTNRTSQSGSGKSGAAVGGQVAGVVSSGRASVDATNHSTNSDVTSGNANGRNTASSFTGLNVAESSEVAGAAELPAFAATNRQTGNNRTNLTQGANASSGDGVGGQVLGVVTAAGGDASVVAANTSDNVSIQTGDADARNCAAAFNGLSAVDEFQFAGCGSFTPPPEEGGTIGTIGIIGTVFVIGTISTIATILADGCIILVGCGPDIDPRGPNAQDGNNRLTLNQTATAHSGDGVGGQIIGVVSGGRASLDATNRSTTDDVTTGNARSSNDASGFAGLNSSEDLNVGGATGADITGASGTNIQDGNNTATRSQNADATSGDAVAGQISGVVTSAGGSASVVVANTSTDLSLTSGDSSFNNDDRLFVGLNTSSSTSVTG